MSTLDEITKEKQRVGEALARVDAQRDKVIGELGELEAAERVLARYSKDTRAGKTASANGPTTSTKPAAPAQSRGRPRPRAAKPVSGKRTALSLSDQVLALATGKTQQEITAGCKGARPNHVGMALAPHKRAGRIEERDGKLYATQSTETAHRPQSDSGTEKGAGPLRTAPSKATPALRVATASRPMRRRYQ